mmetsp:Transcript_10089/g.28742  ORF Transcript_10089/g.28742 Transcript_10089/m.28742 type:complete len:355 (-) Transcript_10089:127-1191(-)
MEQHDAIAGIPAGAASILNVVILHEHQPFGDGRQSRGQAVLERLPSGDVRVVVQVDGSLVADDRFHVMDGEVVVLLGSWQQAVGNALLEPDESSVVDVRVVLGVVLAGFLLVQGTLLARNVRIKLDGLEFQTPCLQVLVHLAEFRAREVARAAKVVHQAGRHDVLVESCFDGLDHVLRVALELRALLRSRAGDADGEQRRRRDDAQDEDEGDGHVRVPSVPEAQEEGNHGAVTFGCGRVAVRGARVDVAIPVAVAVAVVVAAGSVQLSVKVGVDGHGLAAAVPAVPFPPRGRAGVERATALEVIVGRFLQRYHVNHRIVHLRLREKGVHGVDDQRWRHLDMNEWVGLRGCDWRR